jgi:hypothetical protein
MHSFPVSLYAATVSLTSLLVARLGKFGGACLTNLSSPEALGSPVGCVVPLGLRLLWPHPRLLSLLPPYLFRLADLARQPCLGWVQELPHFTLCVSLCVPPSVPRRSEWLRLTVPSPLALAFTFVRRGSAPASHAVGSRIGRLTRLQSSLYATARRFARPSPTRAFTFELSPSKSPSEGVEYHYTGRQSIPVTGLSPARHTALWAATGQAGRAKPSPQPPKGAKARSAQRKP